MTPACPVRGSTEIATYSPYLIQGFAAVPDRVPRLSMKPNSKLNESHVAQFIAASEALVARAVA